MYFIFFISAEIMLRNERALLYETITWFLKYYYYLNQTWFPADLATLDQTTSALLHIYDFLLILAYLDLKEHPTHIH